jgi:subtilase family serine protease
MSRARRLVACAGSVVLAGGLAAAVSPGAAASTGSDRIVYSANPPHAKATALGKHPHLLSLTPAECLAETGGEFACQTPQSIASAYDIPSRVTGKLPGTGKTIVIVDAFGSPTLQSDLATFDDAFGLPAPPSLVVAYPGGKPTFQGKAGQLSWAEETSLDVQWAHAVAPGAKIVLVVAASNYGNVLNNAVRYAVDNRLGDVISMSYGIAEADLHGNNGQISQAHKIFQDATAAGITLLASSGDDGSDNNAGYPNFGYPASDPLVTAVGGTDLWVGSGLNEPRETVWGDYALCPTTCDDGPLGVTGGAPSRITGKQGSDVSYNAGVYTGVLTYLGFLGPDDSGLYFFGGTSAGSPQWAGIVAMVDQARGSDIGGLNPRIHTLTQAGDLYDVTVGANITPTYTGGYWAHAGHDEPTGNGSPDVAKIINTLS